MGQRLNIEIWNDGTALANAYYHWSAYTDESARLVSKVLDFINKNPIDNENILLYAIRVLEATGAGLNEEERRCAATMGIDTTKRVECNGRNDGLLSISQKGIQDTRFWKEGAVYIYLDENRISFDVFYKQRTWEWARDQKEYYGNENAKHQDLDVFTINFDDIKFSQWDSALEALEKHEEPFKSYVDEFEVITPIL